MVNKLPPPQIDLTHHTNEDDFPWFRFGAVLGAGLALAVLVSASCAVQRPYCPDGYAFDQRARICVLGVEPVYK